MTMVPDLAALATYPPQDRESLFLLYVSHLGNVAATAADAGLDPILVQKFVDKLGWEKLIKPIQDLRSRAEPGDAEKAINRAINFAQAHRLRVVLQRILEYYLSLNTQQLHSAIASGRESRDSFLGDLAKLTTLLDKAHSLTYLALGDSPVERRDRTKEATGEQLAVLPLETKLADALAKALGNDSPAAKQLDAELREAQNDRQI
jgi:hypothetical protein